MTLVFSLPFCLLLPDGDYQVKLDKDDVVTLNLTKTIPEIYDERLPKRGFIKGELENINELKIHCWEGHGEWIPVDKLKQITEMKHVIEYKTKVGERIVPQVSPSIIERDVDMAQDIIISPEEFAKSLGEEPESPETMNQMISDITRQGRMLIINAEVIRDPFGRFRYTKVKFTSNKDLHYEEQFKKAINGVNTLISKYRRKTGDYWITKVREEDIFIYKSVHDDSLDQSYTTKGIVHIRPDHSQTIVSQIRESLMDDNQNRFLF